MSMIVGLIYSVLMLVVVNIGAANDIIASAAVLIMYVLIVIVPKISDVKYGVPIILLNAAVICVGLASAANHSQVYDTCMECVRLSALGIPFFLKREFVEKYILKCIYASVTLAALISLGAYIMRIAENGWTANIRMQSVIGYANAACVLFMTGAYMAVYYMKSGRRRIHIIFAAMNTLAAVLTFSRLGGVCFAASLSVWLWVKKTKYRKHISEVYIIAALFIISLLVSGYYRSYLGPTMISRIECWRDALAVIIKQPWGIGAGTWKELQYSVQSADYSVFQIHNSILQIALGGGIAAEVAFVGFFVYIIAHRRGDPIFLSIISMLLLHAFVDMDFYFIPVLLVLGVILRMEYDDTVFAGRYLYIFIIAAIVPAIGVCVSEASDNERVQKEFNDYQNAYLEDDLEVMYEISTDLVRSAPKSCDAYEAYRTAVRKIYRATEETDLSDDIWSLYVDGKDCTSTNPPVVLGDKLMLPIKTISDIFGYTVSYNSISEKMSIYDGSHCVKEAKLKNKIHFSSDGKLEHDIDDIFIVGNRAMVQADKLCDYLPLTAEIDREEKTVYINMAE